MKKAILLALAVFISLSANAYDFMVDGLCYDYYDDSTVMVTYQYESMSSPSYASLSGDLVIPSSVTYDGKTYSVALIYYDAFRNCSDLTSVTIPNTVTTIYGWAFYECTGLTSVTIGESVTEIDECTFWGCSSLTSITIPNSVSIIGKNALFGTPWFDNQPDGLVYAGLVAYQYKGIMPDNTSITLRDDTKGITPYAFYQCDGLKSLTIPNSVITIGDYAFYNCSNLTSLSIGNSVKSIGDYAFNNCKALPSIVIPNSVITIGNGAFASCVALTSLGIGNSVTTIGASTFYGCSGLTTVTIPNSVTLIGRLAFNSCSSLASIYIPSSVSAMGGQVFEGTPWFENQPDGLVYAGQVAYKYKGTMPYNTAITLREGTTGIAGGTFKDCYNLTSVTIPNSVKVISSSFQNCQGLIEIRSKIVDIENLTMGVAAFYNVPTDVCVLRVPIGTSASYRRASQWSSFSNIIEDEEMGSLLGDVDGSGTVDGTDLNVLINILLGKDNADNYGGRADVNSDTQVDGNDLNMLINILLGKEVNPPTPPEPGTQTFTVNGVSFTMVNVEGGTFTMGAADDDSYAYSYEKPAHQVTVSSYSIGQTEVTQALWVAVMGSNPSSFADNPQRPVETITWADCQEFITKLNQMTGQTFRLPTEAEWEFAIRGGNLSQGYWYSGSNILRDVAWYDANAFDVGEDSPDYGTHAVATKAPNELGLYDMSGNVWEWCQDWYSLYTSDAQTNPTGPESGRYRIIRSGSWSDYYGCCRVSDRFYLQPTEASDCLGFRLAL